MQKELPFAESSKPAKPAASLEGSRDGQTFDEALDLDRLNAQHKRVYWAMCDGEWYRLTELARLTGDPEASVSARLRDFRKAKFGEHTIERRRVGEGRGTHEYRLIWNEKFARPKGDEDVRDGNA